MLAVDSMVVFVSEAASRERKIEFNLHEETRGTLTGYGVLSTE